eukprot:126429_1
MNSMQYLRNLKDYAKQKWKGNEQTTIAVGVAFISGVIMLGKYIKKRQLKSKLDQFEAESISENKVILHMPPMWDFGTPHASPYCTKMIAFLEYTKVPYSIDTTMMKHFYTQKMPWITYKNHHQPDSNLIIEWFRKQQDWNHIDIDNHLNQKQLAICTAFKSMIEDGLSQIIGYRRILIQQNSEIYAELIFYPVMGAFLGKILMSSFRRQLKPLLWGIGIARFTEEEIFRKGENLIECIVVTMGNNKFFFGDELSTLDMSIYGHLGGMYQLCSVMTWGPKRDIPSTLPYTKQINEYMKRIEMECFGELRYWKDIVLLDCDIGRIVAV